MTARAALICFDGDIGYVRYVAGRLALVNQNGSGSRIFWPRRGRLQHLAGAPLMAARIETLAASLGLQPETLPAVIATLQREGAVLLVWGGGLEVLPEKPGGTPSQVVHVAPGGVAQVAGRDAAMGAVNVGHAAAIGELVAVLERLRAVQPTLSGQGAGVARAAESTLVKAVAVDVPASERHGLIRQAVQDVKGLLAYAPRAKDWIDVLQKGASLFS